jgi:hypothetical protein
MTETGSPLKRTTATGKTSKGFSCRGNGPR